MGRPHILCVSTLSTLSERVSTAEEPLRFAEEKCADMYLYLPSATAAWVSAPAASDLCSSAAPLRLSSISSPSTSFTAWKSGEDTPSAS